MHFIILTLKNVKAIDYREQALNITKYLNNASSQQIQDLIMLGGLYSGIENNKALDYMQSAIKLAQNTNNESQYRNAITALGYHFFDQGKFDATLKLAKESYTISKKLNDELNQAYNLYHIGNTLYFLGDYSNALSYINKSIDIQKEKGFDNLELSSYLTSQLIYKIQGKTINKDNIISFLKKIEGEPDYQLYINNAYKIYLLLNEKSYIKDAYNQVLLAKEVNHQSTSFMYKLVIDEYNKVFK